ncbi:phosphomannose isomerase type II C-terminal cupin domain [Patescibacteria group bacterium]
MKIKNMTISNSSVTEKRPWGSFTILLDEEDCKVKKIVVKPGGRLSLQNHQHRSELWKIISGSGLMTLNDLTYKIVPGDTVTINQGDIHRIQNNEDKDLVFIEVQTGTYFGEDDIERFEDDYDRVK